MKTACVLVNTSRVFFALAARRRSVCDSACALRRLQHTSKSMSGFKALIGDSESSSSMSGAATSKAFGIDSNVCPSLALSTRIKVFCVLFAIGIVISLLVRRRSRDERWRGLPIC